MEKPVFCKDCIWLKETSAFHGTYVLRDCENPNNEETIPDYYTYSKKHKKHPKVINENNDCEWFVKKKSLWKMFWDGFMPPRGHGPGEP